MHPLYEKAKILAAEERKITVAVLQCLKEINEQKLYLEWGFSSLFAFATEGLGYSEGAAYRRVSAVKLMSTQKDVAEKLESGELTLTAVAQVQKMIKELPKVPPQELIGAAMNKSTRQGEKALAVIAEKHGAPKKNKTITIKISEEAAQILEELRALHSHKNLSDSDLILLLGKKEMEKNTRPTTSAPNESARHIPAQTRRLIFQRDQGRCTYIHQGKRCASRHYLQVDHIIPFARGGKSTPQNLRLLCQAHNLYLAEKVGLIRPKEFRAKATGKQFQFPAPETQ